MEFAKIVFLGSRLFENLISVFCIITNSTTFAAAFECKTFRRLHQIMQVILKGLSIHQQKLKLLKRVNNTRE